MIFLCIKVSVKGNRRNSRGTSLEGCLSMNGVRRERSKNIRTQWTLLPTLDGYYYFVTTVSDSMPSSCQRRQVDSPEDAFAETHVAGHSMYFGGKWRIRFDGNSHNNKKRKKATSRIREETGPFFNTQYCSSRPVQSINKDRHVFGKKIETSQHTLLLSIERNTREEQDTHRAGINIFLIRNYVYSSRRKKRWKEAE